MLKELKVSRRFALRGVLSGIGVAMWLPVLDVMCNNHGTAFAQGDPLPTSFGVFFWGNGVHPQYWTPLNTGTGDAWALQRNLSDFADLKDAMTLVTGLDMLNAVFKGHGWGVVYVLAGGDGTPCTVMTDIDKTPSHVYEVAQATQYMPTVDQVIADAIHQNEPHKSLETGVLPFIGDLNMGTVGDNLAHRGPYQFLRPERDPTALFNTLFTTGVPPAADGGMPSDIPSRCRKSALDAVLADANRLKKRLGTNDAQRLDRHMDSIRAIEQGLPTTGAGTDPSNGALCKAPPAPPLTLADMTAKSQALNRLITAALACNLTRVYSHLWSGPRDDNTYPTIPVNAGHHQLTHGSSEQNEQAALIERYIMSQYADLCRQMKATPLGAGTVLDNTLIYGISEVANPCCEIMTNFHAVVMGHAGGKLPGNRHIRLPGRKVTELVLTLMQTMGVNVTSWGSWDKTSRTMPEILT